MTVEVNYQEIIDSARASYGHVEGRTDIECLCLRISQLEKLSRHWLLVSSEASSRARGFEIALEQMRADQAKFDLAVERQKRT